MAKTNLKDFIFKKNYIPKLICTGIINKIKDAKTKQHQ